jgi:hypothetical protein
MPSLADLTSSHRRRLEAVRAVAGRHVLSAFDALPSPAGGTGFVAEVVPIVLAAQSATVDLVDVYLSAYAGTATGTSTEPLGLDPAELIGAKARNGAVVLETVYRRPLWDWERTGNREAARARITTDVLTDIQLAQRDATFVRMQVDPRLPRWRRVTSGVSCDLCTAAATRTYARINRVHIHPGCDCTAEPVADESVTTTPDPRALRGAYRQLNDSRSPAPVPGAAVHEHGELGPTLAVLGHAFAE